MVDHVAGGPGGPPLCYNDFHDLREGITANIQIVKFLKPCMRCILYIAYKASKIIGVFGTPFLQGGEANALE